MDLLSWHFLRSFSQSFSNFCTVVFSHVPFIRHILPLAKYELSREGQVYIITNPNFPEWVKVGMAVDSEDRLNGYPNIVTVQRLLSVHLAGLWLTDDPLSQRPTLYWRKSFMAAKGEWFQLAHQSKPESSIAELMEQT